MTFSAHDAFMSPTLWHPIGECQQKEQRDAIPDLGNHLLMTIGERIRAVRAELGMTRGDLAASSRVPYPTLAGIENKDQASSTKLHAIASALGVSPTWLATGKGSREAAPVDTMNVLVTEVEAMRVAIAALFVAAAENRQREARDISGWLSQRFPAGSRPALIAELIEALDAGQHAKPSGRGL